MSTINISGSHFGSKLQAFLNADDLEPGATPSYQLCKELYTYHPLGAKMADAPIKWAQSQEREIAVPAAPDFIKEQFVKTWKALAADKTIAQAKSLSRVYGISSLVLVAPNVDPMKPVDPQDLPKLDTTFNVLDPLNTAGSLVLSQNPNDPNFLKVTGVVVSGTRYHPSRSVTTLNESPVYLDYTTSAFGYVGRSVYQRALYPMKSFLQTMVTDDMVSRKAGVLVAKMKPAGSIVDRLMTGLFAAKRALLQQAKNDNVLGISPDEDIESLNLQNLDGAASMARKNILKNIATAADMPAVLLENETLTEGFGEGTEDAKNIAKYVDGFRNEMQPLYSFFDQYTMRKAWTSEFYAIVQEKFPVYKDISFNAAFYQWANSFTAKWPSLLTEPESEEIKVEETKYKAILGMLEVLLPLLDPTNQALLVDWAMSNFNENKMLFPNPLSLDLDAIETFMASRPQQGQGEDELDEPKPRTLADADSVKSLITKIAGSRR